MIADGIVEPRCVHFGVCGGCQLQHLDADAQMRWKVQRVTEALRGVGHPPIVPHGAEPWEYRNRIRLRVANGEIGYFERASHRLMPVWMCPIAASLLWQSVVWLQRNISELPVGASEIELVCDAAETQLQMLVHVDADVAGVDRGAPRALKELSARMAVEIAPLRGAGLLAQAASDSSSRRVAERARVEIARWGDAALTHRVGDEVYGTSRGGFFQVNRFLTEEMVRIVTQGRRGALVMDLFAGAGLFSLPLSRGFHRVHAVEVGEPAVSDLRANLAACGSAHTVDARPVVDALRQWRGDAPDLVVMDPPRAGLGGEVVREVLRIAAPELVYIACDPDTFARDARGLLRAYTMTELHLLDMFPQTEHAETVAVFRAR